MKWNLPFGICVALICAITAAAGEDKTGSRLIGMVNIPGYKSALAQVADSIPGQIFSLKEGQRLGPLEVINIDPLKGAVQAKLDGTNQEWKLKEVPVAGVTGIVLEDVGLDSLLALYAELADRTVLHAALPKISVTMSFPSTNRASVSSALTNALKQNGILAVLDGEKFVIVVPESLVSRAVPKSSEIKVVAKPPGANEKIPPNVIQAGGIDFPKIPLAIVIPLYSELAQAKGVEWDDGVRDLNLEFSLKTQNPLSREEAIYALDTILVLDDIKLVRTADNKIKVTKIQR